MLCIFSPGIRLIFMKMWHNSTALSLLGTGLTHSLRAENNDLALLVHTSAQNLYQPLIYLFWTDSAL